MINGGTMETILEALGEQHAELGALLDPLPDADWRRPTRCEGWSVSDVVLHLAQTDELALASAQGRYANGLTVLAGDLDEPSDVDDGAAALVAHERGMADAALHERWRTGAAALRGALAAADPHRRVDWVAGQLSVQTLATTRLAECWIHTGDVAEALGVAQEPTDRLAHIARLAWRTLPYAFARAGRELAGPVAFDLTSPSGDRWHFVSDIEPATVIEGSGTELCLVAARRVSPEHTSLRGTGPDAQRVLQLVRTFEVTQDQVNQFADITYDHQFIHVDPQRAASTPFGTTIAHGFLTLSMLTHLAAGASAAPPDPAKYDGVLMGINYGFDKVRFVSPVKVGSRIRARAVTSNVELKGSSVEVTRNFTVEIEGEDKPALVAQWLTRTVYA
jgi:uncharacterized protein (TIGR03084 family)